MEYLAIFNEIKAIVCHDKHELEEHIISFNERERNSKREEYEIDEDVNSDEIDLIWGDDFRVFDLKDILEELERSSLDDTDKKDLKRKLKKDEFKVTSELDEILDKVDELIEL